MHLPCYRGHLTSHADLADVGKTWENDGKWDEQYDQWLGLRENLQESPIFNGTIYMVSCKISLKPIQSKICGIRLEHMKKLLALSHAA